MSLEKLFQNHLDGLWLTSRKEVEQELISYFALKCKKTFTSVASMSLLTGGMRFYKAMKVML